jgi:hypothetical protein
MYALAAKDALKADLEHVCIENIQACVVIANICLADSDSKAESLYYGSYFQPTKLPTYLSPLAMLIFRSTCHSNGSDSGSGRHQ